MMLEVYTLGAIVALLVIFILALMHTYTVLGRKYVYLQEAYRQMLAEHSRWKCSAVPRAKASKTVDELAAEILPEGDSPVIQAVAKATAEALADANGVIATDTLTDEKVDAAFDAALAAMEKQDGDEPQQATNVSSTESLQKAFNKQATRLATIEDRADSAVAELTSVVQELADSQKANKLLAKSLEEAKAEAADLRRENVILGQDNSELDRQLRLYRLAAEAAPVPPPVASELPPTVDTVSVEQFSDDVSARPIADGDLEHMDRAIADLEKLNSNIEANMESLQLAAKKANEPATDAEPK